MHFPRCRPRLLLPIVSTAALLTALVTAPLPVRANPFVLVATYDGVINPVSAEYLHDALASAQDTGAQALIIRLNTPGGLDTSMRLIIKDITGATIPVVVYVSPSSGRAASAGVFITLAAHVAAMAPGTNIGAAHPVDLGSVSKEKPVDSVMEAKVANDSSAYLKAIAVKRGRNVDWAALVVKQSTSIPSGEAVSERVVDLEASNLTE